MKSTLLLGAIMALTCGSTLALAQESPTTEAPTGVPTTVDVPAPVDVPATTETSAPPAVEQVAPTSTTTTTTSTYVAVPSSPSVASKYVVNDLTASPAASEPSKDRFRGGFDLSIGAPSGLEAGFVFQPWTHWVRGELGLAHGVANTFGGMASVTFTPIHFPIMPVLELEGGFFPKASLPFGSGTTLPTVGYDWLSFGPGLEFGSRDNVVFFIHPALTYIHASAGNFQAVVDSNGGGTTGLHIGDPVVNGWIMPTARMGLSVLF